MKICIWKKEITHTPMQSWKLYGKFQSTSDESLAAWMNEKFVAQQHAAKGRKVCHTQNPKLGCMEGKLCMYICIYVYIWLYLLQCTHILFHTAAVCCAATAEPHQSNVAAVTSTRCNSNNNKMHCSYFRRIVLWNEKYYILYLYEWMVSNAKYADDILCRGRTDETANGRQRQQ